MGTQFHSTRVAIIGAGNVGATCAYALLLRGLATEIVERPSLSSPRAQPA
jgi:2-polyprenyl-6-methoxyphenol hydroxylase-like FAD-dependent oxidoreductase